jgi:hypothetical protein
MGVFKDGLGLKAPIKRKQFSMGYEWLLKFENFVFKNH